MLIVSYRNILVSGPFSGIGGSPVCLRDRWGVVMKYAWRRSVPDTWRGIAVVNGAQSLVLGFFLVGWICLVAILVVESGIYDGAIKRARGQVRTLDRAAGCL